MPTRESRDEDARRERSRLVKLMDGHAPLRSYFTEEGEVGVVWKSEAGYASVGFWPDGCMAYYARSSDGAKESRAEIAQWIPGSEFPRELLDILRTF